MVLVRSLLQIFDNCEFLLHSVRYVPELERNLLSISMFDDLGCCTRVEHGMLKILHGKVIIAKVSKTCALYILKGSDVIFHSSSASDEFHKKKNICDLRSRYDGCLEIVLEHLNEFCIRR